MAENISKLELKRRIILAAIRDSKTLEIKYFRGKGFGQYAEEEDEYWIVDPRGIEGDFVRGFILCDEMGMGQIQRAKYEDREVLLSFARAAFVSIR